jgi:uncharacterized protein with HEPN domain
MALKKRLTDEEKYGLSEEEIKLAEKYLRKHKTAGALKELEAAKLFELYLLGESIPKIAQQFPQYNLGQVALTASLRGWAHDRDKMMHTLQDRVRAKVVKSVLEQVDFLTAMMSVANAEHLEKMMKYCQDPINNPKPDMRVTNIKEYKDVAETLYKIVSGATPGSGKNKERSPMFEALTPPTPKKEVEVQEDDASTLLSHAVGNNEQEDQH